MDAHKIQQHGENLAELLSDLIGEGEEDLSDGVENVILDAALGTYPEIGAAALAHLLHPDRPERVRGFAADTVGLCQYPLGSAWNALMATIQADGSESLLTSFRTGAIAAEDHHPDTKARRQSQ